MTCANSSIFAVGPAPLVHPLAPRAPRPRPRIGAASRAGSPRRRADVLPSRAHTLVGRGSHRDPDSAARRSLAPQEIRRSRDGWVPPWRSRRRSGSSAASPIGTVLDSRRRIAGCGYGSVVSRRGAQRSAHEREPLPYVPGGLSAVKCQVMTEPVVVLRRRAIRMLLWTAQQWPRTQGGRPSM